MAKKYRLLVFDWDGTLCDSAAQITKAVHAAIADASLPERSDEQIKALIGIGIREFAQHLFPEHDEVLYAQFIDRYRYHFFAKIAETTLFPGVTELLEQLKKQGYHLAIATSKSSAGIKKAIEEVNIEHLFDTTRGADQTSSKPDPHMLEEIMTELMVEPKETLMIGDTEFDLQMAKNAGVDSIAVTSGMHPKEQLMAFEPLQCIDDIQDLLKFL